MRLSSALLAATSTAVAVTMLAGCSSSGYGSTTPPLTGQNAVQARAGASRAFVSPSGIDLRFAGVAARIAAVQSLANPAKKKAEKDVYISDASTNVQIVENKTYKHEGTISSGLNGSDGVWVDKSGNIYVANYAGINVTEYKPGGTTPICTYSTGIFDPINVTTDNKGNVYVDDFNLLNNPGYIDVFKQCSNTMSKQYAVSSGPEGVAVDGKGDIFVSYFNANFNGGFVEFVHGSTTGTPLSATVGSPGGLVLDKKGNLIADDQTGSIDVIAPPYTSATPLVTGLSDPFHDGLNKKENLLFNANAGSADVTVYAYPAGTLKATIGSSNGVTAAEGVSDSPNATF